MGYDLKDGERAALRFLKPGRPLTAAAIRRKARNNGWGDDRRMPFHLERLAHRGLAEPSTLPTGEIGYEPTKFSMAAVKG